MLFRPSQYILFFQYFKKSRFAHFLAKSNQNEYNLDQYICAYYRLSMYSKVNSLPIIISSANALIAIAASASACDNDLKANNIIVIIERDYPTAILSLVNALTPFNALTATKLIKKYEIVSLLAVALLLYNKETDQAYNLFKKCIVNTEEDFVNYQLLNTQFQISTYQKLAKINEIFYKYNLANLQLKQDTLGFNVNNIITERQFNFIRISQLVSILITAYNSSKYIKSTINSLLAQTYQNIELIIIDDCSTDSTWEIIQHFCRQDPRIKAYQQPVNAGTYVAKNRALLLARGEFVMCHDADDWSHPQRIELQLQPLIKNPKLVATISNWIRVADDGNIFARSIYPLNRLNPSSPLFRRKIVMEKIGFWDSVRTGADSEFLHRLKLQFGQKSVLKISPPLAIGAHHENSLMNAPETGFTSQSIPVDRLDYWESWCQWHIDTLKTKQSLYLAPFSVQNMRKFDSPTSLLIPDQTLIYYQSLTQNDLCDSEQK